MNKNILKIKEIHLFLALSALVWIYLWFRAACVPMVHDEVATFFYYIQTGRFLPLAGHWDMNNHFLNSAIGALFYRLFGLSPLVLRLGNLLFFPLFTFFLWKTGELMPGRVARWAFCLSLLLSHGFVEFFALSRGYGMSMALFMAVLYNALRLTESFSPRRMFTALAWMILAVFSNLALINTYLILTGWMLLLTWFRGGAPGKRPKMILSLRLLGAAIPPAAFCIIISFMAREKGLLYTGGSSGLFSITVKSLTESLTQAGIGITYDLLAVLTLFIAGYTVYEVINKKSLLQSRVLFPAFFFSNLLSYWILNLLFHVNYPENRVALYLFPLFSGALCIAAGDLAARQNRKAMLLWMVPLLFFPIHFAASLNMDHAEFYREDAIPARFYTEVREHHPPGDYPPVVGGPRLRHFCWSFLDYRNGGTEGPLLWSDYPGTLATFQIVDGPDLDLFRNDYTIMDSYPASDRYLLRRNVPPQRVLLVHNTPGNLPDTSFGEFQTLFSGTADSLQGMSLYVGFDGEISSFYVPFEARLVAEVKNEEGRSLRYEFLGLNWLRLRWGGATSRMKNGLVIPSLPAESKTLILYIWNIRKAPFHVGRANVEVYRYQ
jgi:hypothetical protein